MFSSARQDTCSVHNYSYRLRLRILLGFSLEVLSHAAVTQVCLWCSPALGKTENWQRRVGLQTMPEPGSFEITREAIKLLNALSIQWRGSKFGPESCCRQTALGEILLGCLSSVLWGFLSTWLNSQHPHAAPPGTLMHSDLPHVAPPACKPSLGASSLQAHLTHCRLVLSSINATQCSVV